MASDAFHLPPAPRREADRATLSDRYALATGRLVHARLGLTLLLFAIFVGISVAFEWRSHPEREALVFRLYLAELLAGVAALFACRLKRFRMRIPAVAAAMGCSLAALLAAYGALVGEPVDTLAIALVCLTTGLAVLLPWGGRAQAAVCITAIASFAIVWLRLGAPSAPYPWIGVLTGATVSGLAAFFLDRLRYEAFEHAELLAHASSVKQEEAEISSALAHVGATLSSRMGRSDVFDVVNRLTLQIVGCEWSTIFTFDEQKGSFRFSANAGSRPEVVSEMADIEFPRDILPLFNEFRPGALVEIPDASATPLVPAELGRRWDVASALYAPIWRGAQLVGVLVTGYAKRRGPFSEQQRRLTLGIVNATAIALENERLVADLQAANRLKSEFVSTMSHELRTPLNVITGYTEMLADQVFGSLTQEQSDLLQRIQRNAEALLELISSTLDLGRLESGRDTVSSDRTSLGDLFEALTEELAPLAQEADVAVRWQRSETALLPIRTDRAKLKTILKNLVGNAVKFTPHGTVSVSATGTADEITIEVRDNGIGIAAEDLSTIFEMFRQVHVPAARSAGGVGLGLHIAKRLAERLGGSITVKSTPGEGSCFTLRLPALFAPRESAQRA